MELINFEIKRAMRGRGNVFVLMSCLLLMGVFFYQYLFNFYSNGGGVVLSKVIVPLFGNLHFLLILFTPMSTLKIISDDDESGMTETYQILNVSIKRQIFSKFIAVWLQNVFLIVSVTLLVLPVLLTGFNQWELIVSNTFMIGLLSACYVSLGIFSNSLFKNFILAGVFHLALILLFFSFSFIKEVMPFHIMGKIFSYLSLSEHFSTVVQGVFSMASVVYFFSFTFVFLYLSSLVIKMRRG